MAVKKMPVLAAPLLVSAILFVGCNTAKGAATGVGTTIDSTAKGAVQDAKGLCGAIVKLDNWIKENLW